MTNSRMYWLVFDRAGFYRWAAQKGFELAGNDIQGNLFGKYSPTLGKWRREEGVAAYKAMARVALDRCRQLRRST